MASPSAPEPSEPPPADQDLPRGASVVLFWVFLAVMFLISLGGFIFAMTQGVPESVEVHPASRVTDARAAASGTPPPTAAR